MSDEFDDVLEVFATFCKIIDEPCLTEIMEKQDFVKIYDCCEFIENFVTKVREQKKEVEFEKYLNHRLSTSYECLDFAKASDKVLEILMKDPRVSTRKIDTLFSVYIQRFGQERFRKFLDSTLKDAMFANFLLNSLIEEQVPISELRDDAIFFSWDKQVTNGKIIEVAQCIDNMLDDNQVSKLIDACLNSGIRAKTKNLIMERFTLRAFENNGKFFQEILKVEPASLVRILQENGKFCTNFLDTVFYFGRSMFLEEGKWISEEGVQYEDIAKIFRILLTESNEISCQTQRQLNIAKEMDGNFWEEIERDCVRLYIVKNVD